MLIDAKKNHNNEAVVERFFHLLRAFDFKNSQETDTSSGKTKKSAGFAKNTHEAPSPKSCTGKTKRLFKVALFVPFRGLCTTSRSFKLIRRADTR